MLQRLALQCSWLEVAAVTPHCSLLLVIALYNNGRSLGGVCASAATARGGGACRDDRA